MTYQSININITAWVFLTEYYKSGGGWGATVPSAVVTSSRCEFSLHTRRITSICSNVSLTASLSWAVHNTYAEKTWQISWDYFSPVWHELTKKKKSSLDAHLWVQTVQEIILKKGSKTLFWAIGSFSENNDILQWHIKEIIQCISKNPC